MTATGTPFVVPLSGAAEESVRAHAHRLADWLAGGQAELTDVGYTLARRRAHLTCRAAVVAADRAGLIAGLRALGDGIADPAVHSGAADRHAVRDPVFVFSGHGSQWAGMGAWLLDEEPAFAEVVAELAPVLAAEGRAPLRDLLTDDYLDEAGFAEVQPAIFTVQIGLAAVLREYGVRPAAVIGQSMGEVAAAAVAGALSYADAARVICRRSELMASRLSGRGATALLELSPEETERRLAGRADIEIAGHTSTRSTVVAGLRSEVDTLVSACAADGIAAHIVPGVGMAIHCRLVDDILPDLIEALTGIEPGTPVIPFYSTATPDAGQVTDAKYWAANLRNPVRLRQAVEAAVADGLRAFVEVAPHPVLVRSLLDTLRDRDRSGTAVATMRRDRPEELALPNTVAALHSAGADVDWARWYPSGQLLDVPTTVWRHQHLWPAEDLASSAGAHPLLGVHIRLPDRHVWQATLDPRDLPWLADHRLAGRAVLPGSAYCELVLACAAEAYDVPPERVDVSDVDYRRLLPLDGPVTLTTTLTDGGARVEVTADDRGTSVVHATATVAIGSGALLDDIAPPIRPADREAVPAVYERLRAGEIQYGPAFAGLTALVTDPGGASCEVRRPESLPDDPRFRFHPALLDACLHGVAALLPDDAAGGWLPAGVGRFRSRGTPRGPLTCRARLVAADREYRAHVDVFDSAGTPVAQLDDVRLRQVGDALPVPVDRLLYTVDWTEGPPVVPSGRFAGRFLLRQVGPGDDRFTAALRAELGDAEGVPAGVVLLDVAPDDTEPETPADDRITAAIDVIDEVVRMSPEQAPPRLFLVTRGARQVADDELPALCRGGLDGLVRTVRDEHPRLRPVHIDLDPAAGPADLAAELTAALAPGYRDTEVALRAKRRHVAALRPVAPESLAAPGVPLVRPGAGYVITGGTRGLGLLTAGRLAQRGAGLLVLNARSAPDEDTRQAVRRIEADGARVVVVRGDIAAPGVAGRLVRAVAEHDAVLRGVVHAAGVLDNALLTDLDAARVRRVWSAKVLGAWRLHLATLGHELDWWVAYSSLAAVIGSAGQANYAAANAHLDALVRWRRARDLPGVTVNWGPVAEVGKVRGTRFAGLDSLRPAQAMAALEELITRDRPQTVVTRLRPGELLAVLGNATDSSFFDPVRPSGEPGFDLTGLARLDPEQRAAAVEDQVRRRVCQVLGFTKATLPASTPLVHLGLDSLAAERIKNALSDDFGVDLPVARLLQGASVRDLAGDLTVTAGGAATARRSAPVARAAERARDRTRRTSGQARRRGQG